MNTTKRILRLATFLVVTGVAALAVAEPDLDSFAQRLTKLRAEVEALSTEVEQAKQTQRSSKRSTAAQKADLEFQLQREEQRLARLRAQMETKKKTLAEASVGGAELAPAVKNSAGQLRLRVQRGLPFKVDERVGEIDEIERKMSEGLLSPQKAAVQLWALVEDELRLGRENGLYRQVIDLDGEEVLVDVARAGMITMYFRTEDGRVGWVERTDDTWTWRTERSETGQRQIEGLFDAMRKQIRTGYFELPGELGGTR